MAKENISESLFQAIDIITSKRLSELEFDKTIIAEIIDTSQAERGEYEVTDGATTFKAYSSDVTFKTGTNVYVTIPNGDYSKQKQIIGKYISEDSEYYTYVSPLDKYVDITGNMCEGATLQKLTANGKDSHKVIAIVNVPKGKDFTRLGVKADFKSWLKNYNVIDGNYGIAFELYTTKPQTTLNDNKSRQYTLYLDCKDMYGNPYAFESFYTQEKVFDLTRIEGQIVKIKVSFYQSNNFIDIHGQRVEPPVNDDVDLSNLFAQNIELSLGYDIEEFSEDTILLYTLDSPTYNYTAPASANQKTLDVRWIRVDENGIYSIDNQEEIPESAIIHWYKFKLEVQETTDELAGPFWEEIPDTRNALSITVDPDTSESQQQYKVVIEYPAKEHLEAIVAADSEIQMAKDVAEAAGATEEQIEHYNWLYSQIMNNHETYSSDILTLSSEIPVCDKLTADLVSGLNIVCDQAGYKGVYLLYNETNEIQNTNESSKARILTAEWHSVVTGDSTLDGVESIVWRIPIFNTMIDEPRIRREYDPDDGITTMWWEMVEASGETTYAYDESEKQTLENLGARPVAIYIKRMPNIKSTASGNVNTGEEQEPAGDEMIGGQVAWTANQEFRIKDYYMESATNNVVKCFVVKNNIAYEAAFEMTFGPRGSNGTDFTFRMAFDDIIPALTAGSTTPVKINITMHDYNNDEVPKFYENGIKLSWYASDGAVVICHSDGTALTSAEMASWKQPYFYIRLKNTNTISKYAIIEALVKADPTAAGGETQLKAITLKTHLLIPCRTNSSYSGMEGATKIVYSSGGTSPSYYKEPYRLWSYASEITGLTWTFNTGDTEAEAQRYYPRIQNNVIIVPSTHMEGLSTHLCAVAHMGGANGPVLWTQPIMMMKDQYSSALLNAWDGSLTIDEENGIILSTMMGAGKKEEDNTFSGVMMGDITDVIDDITKLGLYGFHHGNQAFGWKVDGTGFIGKKGRGQIIFDGNEGTITSGNYSPGTNGIWTGMKIDLDGDSTRTGGTAANPHASDGSLLYAYGGGGRFELNTSSDSKKLLKITDGDGKVLFFIKTEKTVEGDNGQWDGDDTDGAEGNDAISVASQYYLQSSNFSAAAKVGTRLDLGEGKYTSYGKCGRIEMSPNQNTFFRLADGDNNVLFMIKTQNDTNPDSDGADGDSGIDAIATVSQYYLQSSNFNATARTGTRLDLQNGKLTAYGTSGRVEIATNTNTFFRLADAGNNVLFIIKTENSEKPDGDGADGTDAVATVSQYYLQSSNFNSTNKIGTRLDLQNGKFTSYGKFGRVEIASNTNTFFRLADAANNVLFMIKTDESSDTDGDDNYVEGEEIKAVISQYYLQSSDFNSTNHTGTRFDLQHGKYTSYGESGRIVIDSNGSTLFRIQNNLGATLMTIGSSHYYLQSAEYKMSTTTEKGKGFKIDLKNGKISASDFELLAKGDNGYISLSTTGEYAIDVNNKFQVDWDGNVYLRSKNPGDLTGGGILTVESGIIRSKGNRVDDTPFYEFKYGGGRIGPWVIDDKYIYCKATDSAPGGESITVKDDSGNTVNFDVCAKIGVDGTLFFTSETMRFKLARNLFEVRAIKEGVSGVANSASYPELHMDYTIARMRINGDTGLWLSRRTSDGNEYFELGLAVDGSNRIDINNEKGIKIKSNKSVIEMLGGSNITYLGLEGQADGDTLDAMSLSYKSILALYRQGVYIGRHFKNSAQPSSLMPHGIIINDTNCEFVWHGGTGATVNQASGTSAINIGINGVARTAYISSPQIQLFTDKLSINGLDGFTKIIYFTYVSDVTCTRTGSAGSHSHSVTESSTSQASSHSHSIDLTVKKKKVKLVFTRGILTDYSETDA